MDVHNSVIERIKGIINYYAFTVNKFAEVTGIPQSTLNNMLKRGTDPSAKTINSIVNTFGDIDTKWLLTGEGEMLRGVSESPRFVKEEMSPYYRVTSPENGFKLIENAESFDAIPEEFRKWIKPFYPEIKVGAGMELGVYRQRTKYFILVPNSDKVKFWVPVEGQSMYPKYNNRDLVGLAPIHFDGVFGGNNYVVELKTGSAHLKRVDFIKGDNSVVNLHSYNPDFEDKIVEIEKIQGFFKVYMHIGFE